MVIPSSLTIDQIEHALFVQRLERAETMARHVLGVGRDLSSEDQEYELLVACHARELARGEDRRGLS